MKVVFFSYLLPSNGVTEIQGCPRRGPVPLLELPVVFGLGIRVCIAAERLGVGTLLHRLGAVKGLNRSVVSNI